ncbi:Cupredoxin_like_2 domain containing protein [Burkholderiaceae bacterium]
MSFATTHTATLLKYGGISFIAGAVNHGMFSESRSLITAAFGVCFYLLGSWLEMRLHDDQRLNWADVLGVGIVSSVGLGFFTGGLQHFPDSPDRSVWVVPLGFALSLLAMYYMDWRTRMSLNRLVTYALFSIAVVSVGSAVAWTQLVGHADDGHGHTHGEASAQKPDAHAHSSSGADAPTRTVTVTLSDDMRFTPANWQATSGETIRIQLVNAGKVRHEFIIGTEAELQAHAEDMKKPNSNHNHHGSNALSLAAGAKGELVWTFTDAGVLHIACFEPGHYEAGMRGTISVLP